MAVLYRDHPWIKQVTGGKFQDFSFMTTEGDSSMYPHVCEYILNELKDHPEMHQDSIDGAASWVARTAVDYEKSYVTEEEDKAMKTRREKFKAEDRMQEYVPEKMTNYVLNYGEFILKYRSQTVYAAHKDLCVIFFVKGKDKLKFLAEFMDFIARPTIKPKVDTDYISIYRYTYAWYFQQTTRGRSIESVVLPKDAKTKLINDVEEFMEEATKAWYLEKGISYKRSYLFYGVPGSGKTSLITALACKYQRPICYLAPTAPDMTDDKLRSAIISVPAGGIIILEDVDGFFTKDRKSSMPNGLTFSGLLNALDGIGSGLGQIFILTTNFRERLDKALIRNGRVDMQVEFDYVTQEQVEDLFALYYPASDTRARQHFRERVFELVGKVTKVWCLSAAILQNFFITHRKLTFEEAIDKVEDLVEDVEVAMQDAKTRIDDANGGNDLAPH